METSTLLVIILGTVVIVLTIAKLSSADSPGLVGLVILLFYTCLVFFVLLL